MRIKYANGRTQAAVVAEASEWFIEFRAGDVSGEARSRFMEWLRRSPEHIQAYLEVSGTWSELPGSDPEGKFDIASMIARARNESDVIPLSAVNLGLPPCQARGAAARLPHDPGTPRIGRGRRGIAGVPDGLIRLDRR